MLTPPFATTQDLADRWRPLSQAEEDRAETLLLDASQMILDEDTGGVLAALDAPTLSLVRVTCMMVMRAMASGIGGEESPVTQASNTYGPFTEQRTYANPTGDLYLTKAELRSLRLRRQRAGSVAMWAGGYGEVP